MCQPKKHYGFAHRPGPGLPETEPSARVSGHEGVISSAREQELVRRAAKNDRQALRALYDEYAEQLYEIAYRLTDSAADAQDVLHDVFCRLPGAIRTFNRGKPLGPWLRAVTARVALKRLNSERRRSEVSLTANPEELEGLGEVRSPEVPVLDAIVLERTLSDLPDDLRIVVALKEIEGYSHGEIAELLGISRSTSEGRLYRARRMLRANAFER